jgi:hypothetical protein
LFESEGIADAAWRRTLSRESDAILQREALSSNGAVLASFWRLTGFRELARSGPIGSWQPVLVDTSVEPDLERVVRDVGVAFALCRTAAAPDGGRATNELKPNIGSRRRG